MSVVRASTGDLLLVLPSALETCFFSPSFTSCCYGSYSSSSPSCFSFSCPSFSWFADSFDLRNAGSSFRRLQCEEDEEEEEQEEGEVWRRGRGGGWN